MTLFNRHTELISTRSNETEKKKKNHIETILELVWTRNVSVNHKKKNIKLNIADGESLMISHSETEIYSGIQRG